MKLKKVSVVDASILQALGIISYVGLVTFFFWNMERWFSGTQDSALAPVIMLTLLSMSVLICGLITFSYPVLLFWKEKRQVDAVKIIIYQAFWLLLFLVFAVGLLFLQ